MSWGSWLHRWPLLDVIFSGHFGHLSGVTLFEAAVPEHKLLSVRETTLFLGVRCKSMAVWYPLIEEDELKIFRSAAASLSVVPSEA